MQDQSSVLTAAKHTLRGIKKKAAIIFDAPSRGTLHLLLHGERFPALLALASIHGIGDLLGQSLDIDEWLSFSIWNEPGLRKALKAELAGTARATAKVRPLAGKQRQPAIDPGSSQTGSSQSGPSQSGAEYAGDDDAQSFKAARAFLEGEPRKLALVYDAASRDAVHLLLPATRFPKYLILCSTDALETLARQGIEIEEWLVFSVGDDAALCQEIAARLAAAGRMMPIVSPLSATSPAIAAPGQGILPYAVLCAPRCGSSYLTQLLASAGFGTPLEHLRNKQITQIEEMKADDADVVSMLAGYMETHARNGVFGTKVISQYLFELLKRCPPSTSLKDFIRAQFSVIYLVRKDKVGQAISFFLAQHSGTWHAKSADTPETMVQAQDKVDYNFEEILKRYRIMIAQDRRLTILARSLRHWVLFYEDLENDPEASVAMAARFLNRPVLSSPSARIQKIESPVAQRFRAQFTSDYHAVFGTDPEEYEPGQDSPARAEDAV